MFESLQTMPADAILGLIAGLGDDRALVTARVGAVADIYVDVIGVGVKS